MQRRRRTASAAFEVEIRGRRRPRPRRRARRQRPDDDRGGPQPPRARRAAGRRARGRERRPGARHRRSPTSAGSASGCRPTSSCSTTTWRSSGCSSAGRHVSSPEPAGLTRRRTAPSWPRSASSRAALLGCSSTSGRVRARRRSAARAKRDHRADGRARLLRQRRRPTASTPSGCCRAGRRCATRSRSTVHYETELDMSRIGRDRPLAVRPDARRRRVRRARPGARRLHDRGDERSRARSCAGVAEAVLPLAAGPERAVAATKTYLNQVAALALLAALRRRARAAHRRTALRVVADQLDELDARARASASRRSRSAFAFVGRMFVIGRGAEFATAREIALKLLETCRDRGRAADRDRPRARARRRPRPALPGLGDRLRTTRRCRPSLERAERARRDGRDPDRERQRRPSRSRDADYVLPLPKPPAPLLSPLLSVVPGQLFAWALARGEGTRPGSARAG